MLNSSFKSRDTHTHEKASKVADMGLSGKWGLHSGVCASSMCLFSANNNVILSAASRTFFVRWRKSLVCEVKKSSWTEKEAVNSKREKLITK